MYARTCAPVAASVVLKSSPYSIHIAYHKGSCHRTGLALNPQAKMQTGSEHQVYHQSVTYSSNSPTINSLSDQTTLMEWCRSCPLTVRGAENAPRTRLATRHPSRSFRSSCVEIGICCGGSAPSPGENSGAEARSGIIWGLGQVHLSC